MSPLLQKSNLSNQMKTMILMSLIIFSSALLLLTKEASAGKYKLTCKGPYQVVQGNLLATPPCENAYIAKVAQSYGYKVSVKQVRNNIHTKMLDILHKKLRHMLGNQLQTHLIPQHGMPYLHPPLINQNL